MVGYALFRIFALATTCRPRAPTWQIEPEGTLHRARAGLPAAAGLLVGCAALTGVEAISNGVPAFRKPKSKNAATTLLLLGGIAMAMFAAITWLALYTGVKVAEKRLRPHRPARGRRTQKTVIAQIANAVFDGLPGRGVLVAVVTALILVLAANTAFNGFPVLGSILARDGFLPRQLHTRGDRLAFSNGIIFLAALASSWC